jgi:hypothetical protein
MNPTSAPTASPFKHAFDQRVDKVKVPKSDINALVLDYLTMEGYPDAAANFSKEANLRPLKESASIQARQEIQNSIHKGDIQAAIEILNELDPEILDNDKHLHFSLLRLQLIELIRACNASGGGDITPALEFARNELGPRAPTNPVFLEDLEKTMALLLFSPDELDPHLAALLDPALRREAAATVNQAILDKVLRRREAAIHHLIKMRAWAETRAREKGVSLPDRLGLGLQRDQGDRHSSHGSSSGNGHEPMITTI